jgi:hypothetical protein
MFLVLRLANLIVVGGHALQLVPQTNAQLMQIVKMMSPMSPIVYVVVGQLVHVAILAVLGIKKVIQEIVRRVGVMTNLIVDVNYLVVTIGKMRVVV